MIGDHKLPIDALAREERDLANLDIPTVREVANEYIDTDHMIVAVVGDAATQAKRLEALGYGQPLMVKPLQ